MPDPDSFRFDTGKLERWFAVMQPVDDAVQAADSTMPGCCSRTSLVLRCRPVERGYALGLPLTSKRPNETPDVPPQNRRQHVMQAVLTPPMLQVLSVREGHDVAEVTITGQGPDACPPGSPNRVRLDGLGTGTKDVPFDAWAFKAPALLDGDLLDQGSDEMIALLHPFKMPELTPQVWTVTVPGCAAAKIRATIAAFPDVRWTGRLVLSTEPAPATKSGYKVASESTLACHYNGREIRIDSLPQATALCEWFGCLEPLARSAVAVMALRPGAKHLGYDTPMLERHGEFRWEPWPRLSLSVESMLFERKGNGLLGHQLQVQVSGDPLIGARGEISLLPKWLQEPAKTKLLSPLLAALEARRTEEITQELGLWLVADGQVSLRAGVEARLPEAATQAKGKATGGVALTVQARSIRDFETLLVRHGGVPDPTCAAGLQVGLEPPPDSSLPNPSDKKFHALMSFTGCAVSAFEKYRPGIRFRAWRPKGADTPAAVVLLPARSWPAGSEPGQLAEINWCD